MKRTELLEPGSGMGHGPRPAPGRPATVAAWNDVALEAIRILRPGAVQAAGALAVLHGAMYNAWAAYDGAARQSPHALAIRLPRSEHDGAARTAAMAHAAWTALAGRFPAQASIFDLHMASLGLDPAAPAGPLSPAGIGRAQALSLLAAWRDDALPFAPAVLALERRPAAASMPASLHCWALARRLSRRGRHGDDQDVLLYFALAHAAADALLVGAAPDAAAAEVLRRFGGGGSAAPGCLLGKRVGGLVFERARRYWEGKF